MAALVLTITDRGERILHLDEVVDLGSKKIPGEDGEKKERHDEGLHCPGRLGVGKLEADNGDHDLGCGQGDERDELPGDRGSLARVDLHLCDRDEGEGHDHDEEADADFPQGRLGEDPVDQGIENVGEERDEGQDENRIQGLDLAEGVHGDRLSIVEAEPSNSP